MIRRLGSSRRRCGAITLEAAIVYPVMILLMLFLMVGGMGVFFAQLVACQSREAARYACVRGTDRQKDTGALPPTKQQILHKAVWPLAATMNVNDVTIQVYWINGATGEAVDWDLASKLPSNALTSGAIVTNKVQVTVNYQWSSPLFFTGPINLQSTTQLPMSY